MFTWRRGWVGKGIGRVGKDESQVLLETMATEDRPYCRLEYVLHKKLLLFSILNQREKEKSHFSQVLN